LVSIGAAARTFAARLKQKITMPTVLHRYLATILVLLSTLASVHANPKKIYAWHPERSGSGPILIVVDLDVQVAYVYRNGIEIGRTSVSTGRPGHATPTGVFTILGKDVDHHSSIYNNASMPYAERLTWSGVFLHAGGLPGYPSSHGCVHLPLDFAKDLYQVTSGGNTTVVITSNASPPSVSTAPIASLLGLQDKAGDQPSTNVFWKPALSKKGGVAIIVSSADKTVEVLRNGVLIGSGPVSFPPGARALSEAVYLKLANASWGQPAKWVTVDIGSGVAPTFTQLRASGIKIAPPLAGKLKSILKPGSLVITTPTSFSVTNRSSASVIGIDNEASVRRENP